MKARVVSSFAVVLVGLTPTLIGGPVFALSLIMLGIAAFREYWELAARVGADDVARMANASAVGIVAFVLAGFAGPAATALFLAVCVAVGAPLLTAMAWPRAASPFTAWTLASAGCAYVGLPMYAAMALRVSPGAIDAPWLSDIAARLSLGWTPSPRGLAWTALVIVVIWAADTVAFLAGRRIGGRKLAPGISPNKTIAGAIAGLAGAAIVGASAFPAFGLGAPGAGFAIGAGLCAVGQIGDLAESFLKRQAGVKDSGAVIPGHGGLLDRIDALLFALPVAWLIAATVDGAAAP